MCKYITHLYKLTFHSQVSSWECFHFSFLSTSVVHHSRVPTSLRSLQAPSCTKRCLTSRAHSRKQCLHGHYCRVATDWKLECLFQSGVWSCLIGSEELLFQLIPQHAYSQRGGRKLWSSQPQMETLFSELHLQHKEVELFKPMLVFSSFGWAQTSHFHSGVLSPKLGS